MHMVDNRYRSFAASAICWLVVSFSAMFCFLHVWPGYGLLFLFFCVLTGFGLLPWFRGMRALGFSLGVCIGTVLASIFYFR